MRVKSKLGKVKYLAVILSMLFFASCANYKKATSSNSKKEEKIVYLISNKTNLKKKEGKTYILVKKGPIFPSCKGSREDVAVCLEEKVQQHFARNFNTNLASKLNLSPGIKRIYIMFKINEKGFVRNIMVKAPHRRLKREAIRVAKALPRMIPAELENGQKVAIKYSLPLVFYVTK